LSSTFDLAIVGSGFGGSLLAMIARRLGLSVVLLEKARHPRFVIGESTTPLTNLLLEELARRYDLPRLLPLTKWGTWQAAYPEIACGLKRGFTFYQHQFGRPFAAAPDRRDQLLVAASPHDRIADTHWYRPEFDHFFVREAQECGVEYLDETALETAEWRGRDVILTGSRRNTPLSIASRFVVDAAGPRGFLQRALNLPGAAFADLPATQGLYTHFRGVRRLEDLEAYGSDEQPPYPPDDAAVHHVFDGGWIWILRFNNGVASAGVAAVDKLATELKFEEGARGWERLLRRLPTVAAQFAEAEPLLPFIHAARLPFRGEVVVGDRFALLPSAAGFVDPLLSTGFPLTLLGVSRLARAFAEDWGSSRLQETLRSYAADTSSDLLAAERMVAALYANMRDFELFTAVSLLYFAAVSFAEAARRLGRPEIAASFLLRDDPAFGPEARLCLEAALGSPTGQAKAELTRRIQNTIAGFDVAGLCNRDRRNWHPVTASELLDAAPKLGVTQQRIHNLLAQTGFFLP